MLAQSYFHVNFFEQVKGEKGEAKHENQNRSYPPPYKRSSVRIVAALSALLVIFTSIIAFSFHLADSTRESQAASYPDKIVNSDFEYPNISSYMGTIITGWVQVNPIDKTVFHEGGTRVSVPSLNATTLGWKSTQTASGGDWTHPGDIQWFRETKNNDNQYVELVSNQANTAIYQDISTPNAGHVYKWQLDHTSRGYYADSMEVHIGAPGKETPQTAWRISSNGSGAIDEEMTVITTDTSHLPKRGDQDLNRKGWWETYEGIYVIPAGQSVTRFTFFSLEENSAAGNCLDNISFAICHPVHYVLNGGSNSQIPVPQASGRYPGYYPEASKQHLTKAVPVREGYTFLGWSKTNHPDIASASDMDDVDFIEDIVIQPGDNYVYAVWGKNPTISFVDGVTNETISSTTVPFASAFTESIIPPVSPVHDWYDFVGYDKILPIGEKIHEDTIITLNYARNDLIEIPMKIEWRDHNDYARLRPESVTLCLLADGIEIATQSVGASTDWNHVFNNLPAHDDTDGHLISYTVIRKATSGIPDSYSSVDETVSIENSSSTGLSVEATYVATISIPITKIWDDMNDIYGERPREITVSLEEKAGDEWKPYADIHLQSDAVSVDEPSEWKSTFIDIPLWDAETEEMIEWRIGEREIYGYDLVSVKQNGEALSDGFTLTNQIWKHIDMPKTGESSILIWIWAAADALIISSIASIVSKKLKRQRSKLY